MTIIRGDFSSRESTLEKNAEEKEPAPMYQLHISLSFSNPLIWRRIQIPGELTLKQFHQVLQVCMGWSGDHNHQFYVGKIFYNMESTSDGEKSYNEADYDLQTLEEAMKWCFTYIYDAGDGWEHDIVLEETFPGDSGEKIPVVIDGEWASPPEDIGSVHSYEELIHAFENPAKEKSEQILKEHDLQDFNPYLFDPDALNTELKKYNVAL